MSRIRTWTLLAAATAAVGTAATGAAVATGTADAATGAQGTSYRGTSECRAGDVTVSYHAVDAGAGHRYGRITVQNTSNEACSIRGFGGLSYVGGGDGTQIGAPATRTHSRTPRTVLHPGDTVGSAVSEAVVDDYPAVACRPTAVDGFRVYLPDETHSLYVAHPTTGCRDDSVRLLGHKAFH